MTVDDEIAFTPRYPELPEPVPDRAPASATSDPRDGEAYELSQPLHLAVEIALVTGRPLLLSGEPGSGKSTLAPFVARRLDWRYYEVVVTGQTQASDLLWRFDAVRRLADAQAGEIRPDLHYLEPAPLWWGVSRDSARSRGGAGAPPATEQFPTMNATRDPGRAVVLIDEIDKAHPDVPNGLLVALGSSRIIVPYLSEAIEPAEGAAPLVVVTDNGERDLPAAFLRRCVVHRLPHPAEDRLVEIAKRHFGRLSEADLQLAGALARRIKTLREDARPGTRRPSTAEFLDALRACRAYGVRPDPADPTWALLEQLTLVKTEDVLW